jgi:O-antigen/teichoic acid export membrane protein
MIPFRASAHILGVGLTSLGFQNQRLKGVYAAAIANCLLNAYLIPKYSYNGAALSTVITAILLSVFYFLFLSKNTKKYSK